MVEGCHIPFAFCFLRETGCEHALDCSHADNLISSSPGWKLMYNSAAAEEKETGNQSPLFIAIMRMVAAFIAGLVIGTLWSSLRKN